MRIVVGILASFLLVSCAKAAPDATPLARPLPGQVLFTVEVYDVPSGDELVTDSLQVLTAAKALNLRDHLE